MLAENTFINNSLMKLGWMKLECAAVYQSEEALKAPLLLALIGRMRPMNAGCRDAKLLPVNFGGCSLIDAFTVFRRRWARFSDTVFSIAATFFQVDPQ
jgi:hypothetical protein